MKDQVDLKACIFQPCSKPYRQSREYLESIRRTMPLTFHCVWSLWRPRKKHQQLPNCASCYKNIKKSFGLVGWLGFLWHYRLISLMGKVLANGPGDLGLIPGRVIPKSRKMVLDTALLNTQQYKVRIKGKVEQSRERSRAPSTSRCSSHWEGSLLVAPRLWSPTLLIIYQTL